MSNGEIKSSILLEDVPGQVRPLIVARMQTANTIEEIIETIKNKYPLVAMRLDPLKVREFVLQRDPNWEKVREEKRKNPPKKKTKPKPEPIEPEESALETNVEEAIKKLPEWKPDEEFTREETEKLNMLRSHRIILNELWRNYVKVRESRMDTAKKGYLESLARELDAIQKLESAERDLMSALEEVRKAEEAETAEKVLDSILGWKIKRLLQKCPDGKTASELIDRLSIELLNISIDLKVGATNAEAISRLEKRLYDTGFEKPP